MIPYEEMVVSCYLSIVRRGNIDSNVTIGTEFGRGKREKAAQLVAEDTFTDNKIAELIGVTKRTLERWKGDNVFTTRVNAISEAFAERALKHQLARRERRLTVANELHDKLLQVIAERAVDPELANVPGGKTGLITKRLKGIGRGNDFRVVPVYEVDTGTIRETRAIHEQVAEELGQRSNKHEVHAANWADDAPTINVTFVESAKEKLLGEQSPVPPLGWKGRGCGGRGRATLPFLLLCPIVLPLYPQPFTRSNISAWGQGVSNGFT